MRCPDCNKFVGYGEPRTDEIEVEVNETTVSLSGTLYLTCSDCGTDLASSEIGDEQEAIFPDIEEGLPEDAEVSYEQQDDAEIEATERTQDTDRKGKKIKNFRYMKKFYGVSASIDVHRVFRDKDGNDIEIDDPCPVVTVELKAEEQASGFEQLN